MLPLLYSLVTVLSARNLIRAPFASANVFLMLPFYRNGLSISCTLKSLEGQNSDQDSPWMGGLRRGCRYWNLTEDSLDSSHKGASRARSWGRLYLFSFFDRPHDSRSRLHTSVNAPPPIIRFRLLTVVASNSFILLTTHHHMMYREINA